MDSVIQPGSGLFICVLGALIQFFSVSEEGKLSCSTCMQLQNNNVTIMLLLETE